MAETYRFVPDIRSPALGLTAYTLKLDPLEELDQGKRLVQVHRAVELNHRMVIQPGRVRGHRGVRALKLWHAMAPGSDALPLDKAIDNSKWKRPQIFVFSAAESGRLVVTSCLGMRAGMDTQNIVVSSISEGGNGVVAASEANISLDDFSQKISFSGLVRNHMARCGEEGFNPYELLDPAADKELVATLLTVPESTAEA